MWDIQSEACCGLNFDITTSYLIPAQVCPLKTKNSTPDLQRHITVEGWSHMLIHSISRYQNDLYTSNMDVGYTV